MGYQLDSSENDVGSVSFNLVGNAVNGNGAFDSGDKWNILSFSISAPDSTYLDDDENLNLRTISVGDYDSFVAEEDPAVLEGKGKKKSLTISSQMGIYFTGQLCLSLLLVP